MPIFHLHIMGSATKFLIPYHSYSLQLHAQQVDSNNENYTKVNILHYNTMSIEKQL